MLEKTRGKQSVSLPDTLGLVITHIPDLLFVPFCQTAPTHTPTQDCTLFTPIFNLASFKKNMFVLSTHENINLWGYLIVVSFLN